jgi:hypothetical protein
VRWILGLQRACHVVHVKQVRIFFFLEAKNRERTIMPECGFGNVETPAG